MYSETAYEAYIFKIRLAKGYQFFFIISARSNRTSNTQTDGPSCLRSLKKLPLSFIPFQKHTKRDYCGKIEQSVVLEII